MSAMILFYEHSPIYFNYGFILHEHAGTKFMLTLTLNSIEMLATTYYHYTIDQVSSLSLCPPPPSLLLRLYGVPVLLLQELVEGLLRQPELGLRAGQLGLLLPQHALQAALLLHLHGQGVLDRQDVGWLVGVQLSSC